MSFDSPGSQLLVLELNIKLYNWLLLVSVAFFFDIKMQMCAQIFDSSLNWLQYNLDIYIYEYCVYVSTLTFCYKPLIDGYNAFCMQYGRKF